VTGAKIVTDPNVSPFRSAGEPSSSLLVSVKKGDEGAWDRLVRLTSPLVHRWCRLAGVPAADIPDIGQEVYWSLVGHIAAFRRERPGDCFLSWLRTITHNKVRDYRRRRRAQLRPAVDSEGEVWWDHCSPEEDSGDEAAAERHLLYQRALALIQTDFEEKTWQAFWRVEIGEQSPAEAAAALGMSVNAVYLAKSRVRKRLRDEFADLLIEGAPVLRAVTK
jgi:RNA polymerase sigma-70 factor (ECF subfamily)